MNLDIIPNGAIKRVHVSQNDVGRTLTFALFNNSTTYAIPSGAVVKIQGTKPSGLGFSETCTVSGNTATIDTTEAMTDESGNIQTELSISYNGNKIGTSNFVLAVEKNPHPDTTTDGSMETIIPELTLLVNEVKGYAEEIENTYHAYGSPWVASTVAQMTDTNKIYVYTGSESGYTSGNWYYYNGSSWVSGGTYNSVAIGDGTVTKEKLASDVKDELFTTTTTITNNFIENDSEFWNQGAYNNSVAYIVHSDQIAITNHSNLYFGGICDGTLLTSNNVIRIFYFDDDDNLLYTSGNVTLGTTWAYAGTTALIEYPTTSYIIVQFSTNNASVSVTPSTFVANYKLYVGYTRITSFDDWYDHEITTTTSNIDTLEERVTAIEDELPTYWQSYMDSKIATLQELDGTIGTHGFSFVFVTDIHWPNNYQNSPRLIKYILDNTAIDMVICGGDILTKHSTIDTAMNYVNDWRKQTKGFDTINIFGNHDNNSNDSNSSSLWIGYDRWYGSLLKPIEQKVTVWSDDKDYFYIDNEAQKVRMFFLNTGYDQGSTLDNTQAGWLQQLLYNLESGWKAIVFQHIFFTPATVASGTTTLSLHTAGTLAKYVIDSQITNMGTHGADFVGVVCGHVHRDYAITTDNGYPVIATTCDANGTQASLYDPVNTTRTSGTTTEQAFDVYHVDTNSKTIYVTRIGAGSDRTFTY